MVWYSHLFKNFPQLVIVHTVKDFCVVSEAQVGILDFPCFLYDPANVGNSICGSSAFRKSSLYIWKFLVHILLKLSLKDFDHYIAIMWNECNCTLVWTFFSIALLCSWNESWPFPVVLWPLVGFPDLLTYWMQHFNSIIFQDLRWLSCNSIASTRIVCGNASWGHLISHSKI